MAQVQDLLRCLTEFNTVSCIVRLLIASLLGGIIGFEREQYGRPAGLRTHILVCIGSTATVVAGLYASIVLGFSLDPLRTGAQVISGIGFLGAGTIFMRRDNHIIGLTTAAGLWTTAAIGIIIGLGFYVFALMMTLIEIISMSLLRKWEISRQSRRKSRKLYLEVADIDQLQALIDLAGETRTDILPAKSALPGHIGLRITMRRRDADQLDALEETLRGKTGVACVLREQDD